MVQDNETQDNFIAPQNVDELTAIYNDYLYIAREHEQLLNKVSIEKLADMQVAAMHPDKKIDFPWEIDEMSAKDKKLFEDFLDNDVHDNNKKTYITLNHIKDEDNKKYVEGFVCAPYKIVYVNIQMPSMIERCAIMYPENCKVGDTEFFIDGSFKAVFTDDKNKDMSVEEFINNQDMRTELFIMVNLAEIAYKNQCVDEKTFNKLSTQVYANEAVSHNENIILELLGSFADKVLAVCRVKYQIKNCYDVFKRAEEDGFIKSADELQKYINIRNFLRHQWDSLDDLGHFSPRKSDKNQQVRDVYVQSYLELCDKPIVQRMRSYMEALHQMQHVIGKIHPDWVIRDVNESNNKFMQRIKKATIQSPEQPVMAEINMPLASDKYTTMVKRLHALFPQVNIIDEFTNPKPMREKITDYAVRTWYLQSFKTLECLVMLYCITRGFDLRNKDAWDYMEIAGVFNAEERAKWKNYAVLRNMLSHNYFSEELRKRVLDEHLVYADDLDAMKAKIIEMGPLVSRIERDVYEYEHQDGVVVRLDFKNHKVVNKQVVLPERPEIKPLDVPKINVDAYKKQIYVNDTIGCKFNVVDDKLAGVKLPNGVVIDFDASQINLGGGLWLDAHAQYTNVLRTSATKLLFDKNLHVDEYIEKNHKIPFRSGDNLLIDRQHRVQLDSSSRIKEIKVKTGVNNIITVGLKHKNNGTTNIIFADGTIISVLGQNITVSHNGMGLAFDNREIFATTYIDPKTALQQQTQNLQR